MKQTPRYVVRKIGDRFVTEPQGPTSDIPEEQFWQLGGAGLVAYGLVRRGLTGWLAIAGGGGMIYRGLTGRNPLHALGIGIGDAAASTQGTPGDTPSYQHDGVNPAAQIAGDSVDEASIESFPASDPPAKTAST